MKNSIQRTVIGLLAVALLAGCRSVKYVPVTVHTTDTLTRVCERWDSIHIHDSTYIRDQGDTVWLERWHTRYVERIRHDTLREVTHDTIPQPYPVEVVKEVERKLTWWQQTRLHMADNLLLVVAVVAGVHLLRRRLLR